MNIIERIKKIAELEGNKENHKSLLELTLEDLGFRKYVIGESIDGTEDLIHRWYMEGDQWKIDYYIKRK